MVSCMDYILQFTTNRILLVNTQKNDTMIPLNTYFIYYSIKVNNRSLKVNSMIPENTGKIIEFLIRRPINHYNVNQISRELKISVGSAHKILKSLEKSDIVHSEKIGNNIFYTLNMKNKEAQKLSEIVLIESRNHALTKNSTAKVYADTMEDFGKARTIVLFGSILTKKDMANDVDVLFVIKSKKNVKDISDFCLEVSKTRSKPVVPLIMTEKDLKKNIKNKDKVILEIIKTGVVLYGEEVLTETIEQVLK